MFLAVLAFAFTACDDDDPANVTAGFTYAPENNIQAGDTVFFTNTSAEAVAFEWSFGDGETSSEAAPFHVYNEPGIYDVTLVATNGGESNTAMQQVNVLADLAYIINYGSYSGDKATISAYDKYAGAVINEYYTSVNGVSLVSNVQYAYNYNGKLYMMGNNSDQVLWVDSRSFEQTANAITDGIVKPRCCTAKDDYLYVSCWGGSVWSDPTVSYLAVVNLNTKELEKTIPLQYGPEGVEIVGNKLYAALNYTNKVAVVDLSTDAITYIDLPEGNIPSYFEKDANGNLYVVLGIAYGDNTTQTGIGFINTTTDSFEERYDLDGVSSMNYVDVIEFNADFSRLYVVTTGGYLEPGGVAVFDVASKSFEAEKVVDNITGINGIGFYNDQLFCFLSESATIAGKVKVYNESGTEQAEYGTGIAPFMLVAPN